MIMLKRVLFALTLALVPVASAFAQPPAGQTEFVPIDQLPPSEQLPAAPFLIAAYAIIWLLAMFYVWTIWRRMNRLEGEFRTLERRSGSGRGAGR
jgi:CcmD family protein